MLRATITLQAIITLVFALLILPALAIVIGSASTRTSAT
jgi:hypothetical protein